MEGLHCKTCNKCGAKWMEGILFWSTGAQGKNEDLAGLVCNNLPPEAVSECINPARGDDSGTTWAYRRGYVDGAMEEMTRTRQQER